MGFFFGVHPIIPWNGTKKIGSRLIWVEERRRIPRPSSKEKKKQTRIGVIKNPGGSAWCYVLRQNSCRAHWLRLAIQWCFQGPILSNTTNFERPLLLVGGFNPVEKYSSNWINSPGKGENKKIFETTTQFSSFTSPACWHTSEQSSTCQVRSPASKLSQVRLVIWPKTGFVLCMYLYFPSKHHKNG